MSESGDGDPAAAAARNAEDQLDWIQASETLTVESFSGRSRRKFAENPFVPIGCIVTAGVLAMGMKTFYRGDSFRAQKLMRWRVGCQGATILAMALGLLIQGRA